MSVSVCCLNLVDEIFKLYQLLLFQMQFNNFFFVGGHILLSVCSVMVDSG